MQSHVAQRSDYEILTIAKLHSTEVNFGVSLQEFQEGKKLEMPLL